MSSEDENALRAKSPIQRVEIFRDSSTTIGSWNDLGEEIGKHYGDGKFLLVFNDNHAAQVPLDHRWVAGVIIKDGKLELFKHFGIIGQEETETALLNSELL